MSTLLPVVTNSQMKCFRRCPREHLITYTLGIRSTQEPEALRFGSLAHTGLEGWWKGAAATRLAAALAAMAGASSDAYELARANVMLRGYDARWGGEAFETISVEHEFRAPLVNPETGAASRTYELGGKLDVVVRDLTDGRVKLVEHKTTSEDIGTGSDYWKRLTIDPQISTYFAGGKAAGFAIEECIYDVLGKPGLRPTKATPMESRKYTKDGKLYAAQHEHDETPVEFEARLAAHVAENSDRYYQRGLVVRLESEEADAAYDTWHTARLIREAELANRWPRNPDACVRFGRTCHLFGVCTGSASLDDESLFRRTPNQHEELSGAA